MRSLSATLLAAQKAASGIPYVRAVVSNTVRQILHLVFSQTFTSGDADDRHAAAADATYLHRARVSSGSGYAMYERNAGTGWINMSSTTNPVHIAIAAINNARVMIVYNRLLGIYFRESTDQGATWGAETLITTSAATVNALALAYKTNGGDLCLIWADGATMKRIRRTAGTFGAVTSWAQTANSINGAAMLYYGDFLLVVTGVETTTLRPTVWSLVLGDAFSYALDLWTAFFIQAQAESDESLTFQAPSIGLIDTPRMTFVEKFSGTPAYTRTYWSTVALTATYSPGNWEWMDPVPLNNTTNYGYAVTRGKTPNVAIYSRVAQVLEAATATVSLDMSADLIEAAIEETDGIAQRAELIFDNSNNQYAGPPAPIAIHRTLALGLGYDALYSSPPSQSIVAWEYRRTGGRALFVLKTRGNDYWLALSKARTTIVETRKMTQIARAGAARAGLDFLGTGASSRATNLNLEWVVNPDQNQLDLLRALIAIMPDILLTYSVGTLMITQPLAGDSVDYTYGTDHAIYSSRYAAADPATLAEILAAGAIGQAFDFATMNNDKPRQDRRRSPHETAAADANDNAAARLRKAIMSQDLGELVTPPNCGIEVADIVAFTDLAASPSQIIARVTAIKTTFRRRPSSGTPAYEQRLSLTGV